MRSCGWPKPRTRSLQSWTACSQRLGRELRVVCVVLMRAPVLFERKYRLRFSGRRRNYYFHHRVGRRRVEGNQRVELLQIAGTREHSGWKKVALTYGEPREAPQTDVLRGEQVV